MLEEKEHYKMYKDGKHWVAAKISTVAGITLFSTMILGGGHVDHVSADTVSTNQVSQARDFFGSLIEHDMGKEECKNFENSLDLDRNAERFCYWS